MDSSFFNFYPNTYYKNLEIIGGIKFTHREIDIISCLISGKGEKTIASILLIEPRGVESQTRNIRLKLNYNAKDRVIEFIEKTDKALALRAHYQWLLLQSCFKYTLKKISETIDSNHHFCRITYNKEEEDIVQFVEQLKKYLKLSGVKIVDEKTIHNKELKFLPDNKISYSNEIIISVSYKVDHDFLIKKNINNLKNTILILLKKENSCVLLNDFSKEIKNIDCINFTHQESYYFLFTDLLKKIISSENLGKIIKEFKENYKNISVPSQQTFLTMEPTKKNIFKEDQFLKKSSTYLLKEKNKILLIIIIFSVILIMNEIVEKKEKIL